MATNLNGYFRETQKPVYSAALILPFLLLYHAGTFILHTTYINGADALIIRMLSSLSVHSMFGSALILAACFAIWQLRSRASWKINSGILLAYFLESVCFALILLFAFGWLHTHLAFAIGTHTHGLADLVLYCGAGIYEELVFRGFLLGVLTMIFYRFYPQKKSVAASLAAIIGALLFSFFHYIGSTGDAFAFGSFFQRFVGGLFFSAIFLTRGFGATAASHAIYDILVGIILT